MHRHGHRGLFGLFCAYRFSKALFLQFCFPCSYILPRGIAESFCKPLFGICCPGVYYACKEFREAMGACPCASTASSFTTTSSSMASSTAAVVVVVVVAVVVVVVGSGSGCASATASSSASGIGSGSRRRSLVVVVAVGVVVVGVAAVAAEVVEVMGLRGRDRSVRGRGD